MSTARADDPVPALSLTVRDPFDVTWRERVLVLGGVLIGLALLIIFGFVYAPEVTGELFGLVPVSFFAVGKFLPLWGISGKSSLDPYQLGLVIWVLDTFSVVAMVYALEGLYRIRPLKRGIERVQVNASLVLAAYPRMRRGALVGVVLFVLFPVAGTGAVGASFIGILLGMHRAVLIAAVSLGGCLGGFLMAFAAVNFEEALVRFQEAQKSPAVKYAIIASVVLVLFVVVMYFNRVYKRALRAAQEAQEQVSAEGR